MALHLGVFVMSNSKIIMNNFPEAIVSYETNEVNYGDTDFCISKISIWTN